MILETTKYAHGLLWHLQVQFRYDGELVEITAISTLGYYPDDRSEVRVPLVAVGDVEALSLDEYDDLCSRCERFALSQSA